MEEGIGGYEGHLVACSSGSMACDLTYRERIKEYQELNAQTVGVKKAAVLFMISVCRSYCHIGLASDRQSHASDALFPFLFPILFLFLSLIHSIFLFNKHGLVQFMPFLIHVEADLAWICAGFLNQVCHLAGRVSAWTRRTAPIFQRT